MLTAWRRAWPASVLPVLALVAALAWPAAAPEEQRLPAQPATELTVPRKAEPSPSRLPQPRPTSAAPRSTATVRQQPATVPPAPSPSSAGPATPTPAATTSPPALEQCVADLLGEVGLDC